MYNVILTTEYFGPVSSYYCINNSEQAYTEYHENYQKKSYRNRCRIGATNGVELLSVPLKSGKSSQCPISEVEISYHEDWVGEHAKALLSAYGKSPFYEYLIDDILDILNENYTHLIHLNTALQTYIIELLELDKRSSPTVSYERILLEDFLDLRKYDYLNRKKIELPSKPYQQVWSDRNGWQEDLSILDLLFCKGKEGVLYI